MKRQILALLYQSYKIEFDRFLKYYLVGKEMESPLGTIKITNVESKGGFTFYRWDLYEIWSDQEPITLKSLFDWNPTLYYTIAEDYYNYGNDA